MRVNQNVMAVNAHRNLTTSEGSLTRSLERLSSGFRINRAADDAAGLVISESLRSQVMGLKMATRNAQDGVSVVQTAEGALTETHAILQRMRELTIQASSTGSSDQPSRDAAQAEVLQLKAELERIAETTTFGQQQLLTGNKWKNEIPRLVSPASTIDTTVNTTFTFWPEVLSGQNVTSVTLTGNRVYDANAGAADAAALETDINNALVGALAPAYGADAALFQAQVSIIGIPPTATFGTTFKSTLDIFSGAANNHEVLGVHADGFPTPTAVDVGAALGMSTFAVSTPLQLDMAFQVGAGSSSDNRINVQLVDVRAKALKITAIDVSDATLSTVNLTALDNAIERVSTFRGNLGAYQNRFEHTINNLSVTTENLSSSESRIRDTDMAGEMQSFTRAQVLQQAGTAMLAQANSVPQAVLQLLK